MTMSARVTGFSPTVVHVSGELDVATAPRLRACLASIDGDIIVDCSGLEFVDAAGLSVFVSCRSRCERAGAKFDLENPSELLMRVLCITGLRESLTNNRAGGDHDGIG